MVEKSDIASEGLRLRNQLAHHQTSKAKRRTLLPSIESGKLLGESFSGLGIKHSSVGVTVQDRNYAQQPGPRWGIRRSRASGITGYLHSGELASSSTEIFPIKMSHHKLSAGKHHGRSAINDKAMGEEQRPTGALKGRKNLSTTKLGTEKLQFPEVNLKPKLGHDLCSPTQQPGATGQTVNESWEPFSSICKYCGLKYGKHSIAIHEKTCSTKQQSQTQSLEIQSNDNVHFGSTTSTHPVARIVTIGLGSSQYDELTIHAPLPPRPETQTLQHSSLRNSAFGLPYVPSASDSQSTTDYSVSSRSSTDTSTHGMTLCDKCGRVVATDRIKVHSRLCKPETYSKVNTSSVKFPSACNLLKVEQSNREPKMSVKRPPTVECYICGKKYGTKSISIHEPQCLKKFEIENRKLPINKRKPLPKKLREEKPKVAGFVSIEDEMVVISGRPVDHNSYKDLVDETMDFIFQQCYSDFQHELVPCKRCGRKFAPNRHKKHEPNCNAKPLSGQNTIH